MKRLVTRVALMVFATAAAACASPAATLSPPTATSGPSHGQTPAAGASATSTSGPTLSRDPSTVASRHVVVDTDMAPDDWIAILYLLNRADITIDAITVTGTGEAHCEPGVKNAAKLTALAGQPGIPVACGRETPLGSDHGFPDEWRAEVDALLGLELPDGSPPATDETAPELLTRTIHLSPGDRLRRPGAGRSRPAARRAHGQAVHAGPADPADGAAVLLTSFA
jgi:hypothetical protein